MNKRGRDLYIINLSHSFGPKAGASYLKMEVGGFFKNGVRVFLRVFYSFVC